MMKLTSLSIVVLLGSSFSAFAQVSDSAGSSSILTMDKLFVLLAATLSLFLFKLLKSV